VHLTLRRRSGFTLVELIVTMVIMGAVLGTLLTVLVRQQRFYRGANDIMEARTQVRQATDMLPADLRVLSSSDVRNGTDFYTATDKTLDFRTVVGSSILCKTLSSTSIVLPPTDLSKGTVLSTWVAAPQSGDSLFIYDDSSGTGNADDHWAVYEISSVGTINPSTSNACGVTTGYVQAADVTAGRVSYKVTLGSALASTISVGAPIRIFHRRRYELYQPSGASGWYLGTYECRASCGTLSPVSGPFASYSAAAGNTGLRFTYLDSLGNELTPTSTTERAKIWRIVLVARADTRAPVDIPGKPRATVRDSLSLDVALRNRK
jgi:prepilin-type N-terminal cleavage/methylation domain-containing protein